MHVAPWAVGALVAVGACQRSEGPEQAQAASEAESAAARQEIEATIADYERWVVGGNLDSMLTIVTEDVRFMPPNEPTIVGRDQWRQWLEPLLQVGQWTEDVTTGSLVAHGPVAIQSGRYTLSFTPGASAPAGMTTLSDTGKYLWSWRRVAGRWLLAEGIWNSDRPLPVPAPVQ